MDSIALKKVSKHNRKHTPVYVGATAGMRLLWYVRFISTPLFKLIESLLIGKIFGMTMLNATVHSFFQLSQSQNMLKAVQSKYVRVLSLTKRCYLQLKLRTRMIQRFSI